MCELPTRSSVASWGLGVIGREHPQHVRAYGMAELRFAWGLLSAGALDGGA